MKVRAQTVDVVPQPAPFDAPLLGFAQLLSGKARIPVVNSGQPVVAPAVYTGPSAQYSIFESHTSAQNIHGDWVQGYGDVSVVDENTTHLNLAAQNYLDIQLLFTFPSTAGLSSSKTKLGGRMNVPTSKQNSHTPQTKVTIITALNNYGRQASLGERSV